MELSNSSTVSDEELGTFLAQLHINKNRADQDVAGVNLVTHSSDVHWLTPEQTGNPSHIGLLLHIPNRTSEFLLQRIPAGSATDLQRHVHESVHYVVSGSGYAEIGSEVVDWAAGDFVYTPPWIWHRFYAGADADVEMIIVENSRIVDSIDAGLRESHGNVSFAEKFGAGGEAAPNAYAGNGKHEGRP